ncbi:MAG: ArnT family glycosyltransferase [Candidatus Omnitrophota bacterium]
MKKKIIIVFVGILLALFAAQCVYFAWQTGQTTDETFYNGSGYPILRYADYRHLGEHPPLVMQWGAVPLLFLQPRFPIDDPIIVEGSQTEMDLSKNGAAFLYKMGNDPWLILFLERFQVIGLAILLAFFVFQWSKELFGLGGGLFSLFLFALSPNMVAYGSLYTTDIGVAVFFFLSAWCVHRFFREPSFKRAVWIGLCAGLALVSKISGVIVLPAIVLLLVFYLGQRRTEAALVAWDETRMKKIIGLFSVFYLIMVLGNKVMMVALGPLCILGILLTAPERFLDRVKYGRWIFRILLTVLWILALVYCIRLFRKYESWLPYALLGWVLLSFAAFAGLFFFRSSARLRQGIGILLTVVYFSALIVIVVHTDFIVKTLRFGPFNHYLRTFAIAFSHTVSTHQHCVEGSFVTCDWKYYLALFLIKVPLLTLLSATLGVALFLGSRRPVSQKLSLLVPPLLFLAVASFLSSIRIGIRHILPIFPFFYLWAGAVVESAQKIKAPALRRIGFLILGILMTGMLLRHGKIYPHYLSYFNETIGNVAQGVHFTSAANTIWGQDNRALAEAMKARGISHFYKNVTDFNNDIMGFYGIKTTPLEGLAMDDPPSGYHALSVDIYEKEKNNPGSWYHQHPPEFQIGETIYVFKKDAEPGL